MFLKWVDIQEGKKYRIITSLIYKNWFSLNCGNKILNTELYYHYKCILFSECWMKILEKLLVIGGQRQVGV